MISMQSLLKCLQESTISGARRGRRRRRRGARRGGNTQPVLPTPSALVASASGLPQRAPRRARRRQRNGVIPRLPLTQGEVTLSRSERFQDVTKATNWTLHPHNLPWLANLVKAFDMVRWDRAIIEYRPLVGTTSDGAVAVGFDWAQKEVVTVDGRLAAAVGKDPTRDNALACTPCFDIPFWGTRQMHLEPSRLRQRNWWPAVSDVKDLAYPGSVLVVPSTAYTTAKGEIWLHYTVTLSGTRTVA